MSQALPIRVNAPVAVRLLKAPGVGASSSPKAVTSQAGPGPLQTHRAASKGPMPVRHPAPLAGKRGGVAAWMRIHKMATASMVAFVVVSAAVVATVLIRQDIATTPSAVAPEVTFLSGTDYTSITNTGFGVLTLGTSGASATLSTLKGIPGASTVDLTNLLRIQGAPTGTKDYTGSSLSTDVALNAAITHLYITIKHGATTDLNQWDAKSGVASSTFTITHAVTYDVSVSLVIADGTAAGGLGTFNIQLNLVP